LLDGKPMAGAMIILHPQAEVGLDGLRPRALADADGWFNIYTFKIGDGAPLGQYAVTIQPKKPKQEHGTAKSKGAKRQAHASAKSTGQADGKPATRVAKSDNAPKTWQKKQKVRERNASCPARYRDPAKSGLQIEVKEGANELAPFELASSQEDSTQE
jgi:hypothetical protein